MARRKNEETFELNDSIENTEFKIDEEAIHEEPQLNKIESSTKAPNPQSNVVRVSRQEDLVNCLKNEKVIVRFLARPRGMVTDPKHVLYGGMANGAKISYTVPLLRSGGYVDVLTKAEKAYLEYVLGLETNALSVHNKNNNFWDDANDEGIGRVTLIKGDNPLNLSDPIDYIKYKILLANKDYIAPSTAQMQDKPKATYKFVIVREDDSTKTINAKVSMKQSAYMEFGKISDNKDKLKVIIETIEGRPIADNSKLEYLQARVGDIIEANTKLFLQVVKDPYIDNKILIRKAISAGVIAKRGNYLYLRDSNLPLCDNNQEPTLNVAAKWLSLPVNQELKFSIEAKIQS